MHTHSADQFIDGSNGRALTAEASSLGWMPGEWPQSFNLTGAGNGRPFLRVNVSEAFGLYMQEFGCICIKVWND